MAEIILDFETASHADLKECGAWRYSEDVTTEILCLCYTCDGEIITWKPGDPRTLLTILAADPETIFIAHNAGFEKAIWRNIMVPLYVLPDVPNSRWDDTLAACAMRAIPLDLDRATLAMRLVNRKDKEGSALTRRMSQPNRKGYYDRTPETLSKVYRYCEQDILAERDLRTRLGPLPAGERNVWLLDQRINERGVLLDLPFIEKAQQVVDRASIPLVEEFSQITGGLKPSQVAKVRAWVEDQGVYLDSLNKEAVAAMLGEGEENDETPLDAAILPDNVHRALLIRSLVGSASIKKLARMRACVGTDGRARGLLQYHGASPGRWAGRLLQPQNFPRGTITDASGNKFLPETLVEAIMSGDPETVEMIIGPAIESVVSALRHTIIASPGRVLLSGDFAGVEARMVLALSGQGDKTELMASGKDVYCDMAEQIYKRPIDKKKDPEERQVGKNCFVAGTLVLTSSGIRVIEDVREIDLLWDGEEWVKHSGLVYRGVKPVLSTMGIEATPEHPVLCGEQWLPWGFLARSESARFRALERGSRKLPSRDMFMAKEVASSASSVNAHVVSGHISCTQDICGQEGRPVAPGVRRNKQGTGVKSSMDTLILCQTKHTVYGYLTGSARVLGAVKGQLIHNIKIMANVASAFGLRGKKTVENFSHTLSPSPDGINPNLNLTVENATKDTNPVISGLLRDLSTSLIKEASSQCSGVSLNLKPVFDLANAGPLRRFTILSDQGPVIVHNSVLGLGFGMGWKKFKMKYGQKLSEEFCQQIIRTYRDDWAPCVPKLWWGLEEAALATVKEGRAHEAYGVLYEMDDRWLTARLPSGRKLWYFNPQVIKRAMPWDDTDIRLCWTYQQMKTGQFKTIDAFGGLLCENVVQGLARDLMVEAMFKLEKNNFPIILTVHDEIVCEPLAKDADEKAFEQIMADIPAWAKKIQMPVAVETWVGDRYRK